MAEINRGTAHDFVEKLWATRRVGDLIDQIDLHGQSRELVDELVALSTRYGILTPYTAFLADENVPLHVRANARLTEERLSDLGEISGRGGVEQRAYKQRMLRAEKANAAVAAESDLDALTYSEHKRNPLPAAQPAQNGAAQNGQSSFSTNGPQAPAAGAAGGFGYGGRPSTSLARTGVDARSKDRYREPTSSAANVRRIGTKTFYRKGDHWVDSDVKPEDEAKAIVIRQFSDEFFALARDQKAEMNQYLTFDETVTVNLDGKIYRFEQAAR